MLLTAVEHYSLLYFYHGITVYIALFSNIGGLHQNMSRVLVH